MLCSVIATWTIYRVVAWQPPTFAPSISAQSGLQREQPNADRLQSESYPAPIGPVVAMPPQFASGFHHDPARHFLAIEGSSERARPTSRPVAPTPSQGASTPPQPMPAYPSIAADSPARVVSTLARQGPELSTVVGRGEEFVQRRRQTWSGDAWIFLRDDNLGPSLSENPGYGRSQAGAVLRYNLVTRSSLQPRLYARVSAAISAPQERELASGVSVRPVPSLPIRVQAEGRLTEYAGGSEVRAAAFAVTELPVARLPGKFRLEGYAQGGYVTGEFATPFVDGQVRIQRSVPAWQGYDLQLGAGAWGGAQERAGRLDVGPTVSFSVPLGRGAARVSADYRFRVAGDAEPSSGPALTLSAGF